jgi:DNA polymerase-3 subunit gamma/tau
MGRFGAARPDGDMSKAKKPSADASAEKAATQSTAPAGEYRVLARKYRPSNFDDLIGQDAMVRTLSNAFESGRIPQAWILTGVRGVGKTTTARIIARALNYELADGSVKGPTIDMPVPGLHDEAIIESRHPDVLEMDAASHNGVEDVRQINDAIRYAPMSARYKVYILDEVHMLSGAAFNALLKTLEEPPPHAKFVFATTEIRKVPVTVLSRCQRFDLRRVDASLLVKHLEGIAQKENIEAEPAALALIARAAEGSVRDSLSLFDQAIAHAAGPVRAEDVRQMLGLADRVRVVDLFEALMKGDTAAALKELREQYDIGADPAVVLTDLADFTHFVTRVKVVPSVADDVSLSEAERVRGKDFATKLSMRVLSRTWQMLLKGIAEAQAAPKPIIAAEMVMARLAYAADLPTPDEAVRALVDESGSGSPSRPSNTSPAVGGGTMAPSVAPSYAPRFDAPRSSSTLGAPRAALAHAAGDPVVAPQVTQAQAVPTRAVPSFDALIALCTEKRDITTKMALERDVRLVRFEDGKLEIALERTASRSLIPALQTKLTAWTARRWVVVVSSEQGETTKFEQARERDAELKRGVRTDPLVQAVLSRFPGAEIVGVTQPNEDPGETVPPPPDESEHD